MENQIFFLTYRQGNKYYAFPKGKEYYLARFPKETAGEYSMKNILNVLIFIFTFVFSLVCGLSLVQLLIPAYFNLFSPIPGTLNGFYFTAGVFFLFLLFLIMILFKKKKYNWGLWILVTALLSFGFGIPIFMLENNDMLWHEAVFNKPGPVYFIEFSEDAVYRLKFIRDLYVLIWRESYLYIYAYLVVYLGGYFCLWKLDWRIGSVRIKI